MLNAGHFRTEESREEFLHELFGAWQSLEAASQTLVNVREEVITEVIGNIGERLEQLRIQIANIEQNRIGDDYIQGMNDYFEYGEDKAQEMGMSIGS